MRRFLTLVLSLTSVQTAYASDWKTVDVSDGGVHYLDVDSVRESGKYLQAWSWVDYMTKKKDGSRSRLNLDLYDCDGRAMALTHSTNYTELKRSGKVVSSNNFEVEWDPVMPDTIGEALFEAVCSNLPAP